MPDSDSESAEDFYRRQKYYDHVHHQKRIQYLESLPKLSDAGTILLKQSRRAIADPCYGYHSVDLEDAEYLAELDAWYIANKCTKGN